MSRVLKVPPCFCDLFCTVTCLHSRTVLVLVRLAQLQLVSFFPGDLSGNMPLCLISSMWTETFHRQQCYCFCILEASYMFLPMSYFYTPTYVTHGWQEMIIKQIKLQKHRNMLIQTIPQHTADTLLAALHTASIFDFLFPKCLIQS